MKRLAALCLALILATAGARAQWLTKTYTLAPGWNGIWLSGDASYATIDDLLAAYPGVSEVWRWNPDPNKVQFSDSPSTPTTTTDEWTVWKRGDRSEQVLQRLVGNSAYLLNNSGTTATSVSIKQLVRAPANTWLISGANFMGFPSAGTSASWPAINTYFASFINGSTAGLPSGTKIYKYVGGALNSANPIQVSATAERLDPDKAYWFNLATVSDFSGALSYELPGSGGLSFGRTQSALTIGVINRSTSNLTLTLSLDASESAPSGQPAVTGGVPLTRRVFNSASNAYDETAVPATGAAPAYTVTLPPSGRANLDFGINRAALSANSSAFYASILRIKDSANLTDVRIPVSAQPATTAGLWLAQVDVSNVVSTQPNSGSTTTRPFPLNVLIHMDSTGTPRLLRQVYLGRLVTTGNPLGVAVSEARVLGAAASDVKPTRYYAPMMPAGSGVIGGSGAFSPGSSATWTITHSYNDPVNPFVHAYHPDHDNLDARFTPLTAGKESYTVVRNCVFAFTAAPPNGSTVAGWGATVLGGTYSETLTGLHKNTLSVSGTFAMRRISEIADIDLTSP